jgi:hypothetical protein
VAKGGMPNDNNVVEAINRAHKAYALLQRWFLNEYIKHLADWVRAQ